MEDPMRVSTSCAVFVSLWLLLGIAGGGGRAEADGAAEIRLLCFGPSPYTSRHDSMRAGFGIYLLLQQVIRDENLPLKAAIYDAFPSVENADKARALLRDARVLVVGTSTLAQGSPSHVRRFFEQTTGEFLGGASASAWATSGGAFTLGERYMVFVTDERLDPPTAGEFAPLDLWFMDQFARYLAVVALAGDDRAKAAALSARLRVSPAYYQNFPRDVGVLQRRYGALRDRLNAAASPTSEAWRDLLSMLTPY